MRGRAGAMICSVSSVGGRYGVENWSVYSATKFAVVGFHDALRKELGPDRIRVTVIEPGAVWTEFGHNVAEALDKRRNQLDPGACLFLRPAAERAGRGDSHASRAVGRPLRGSSACRRARVRESAGDDTFGTRSAGGGSNGLHLKPGQITR